MPTILSACAAVSAAGSTFFTLLYDGIVSIIEFPHALCREIGERVARIVRGAIFLCEAAVRLLDLVVARVARNAEDAVGVIHRL